MKSENISKVSAKCRPNKGEGNKAYMKRCMHKMLKEQGRTREKALAICLGSWRSGPIGKSQKKALEEVKQNMSDVVDTRMSAVNKTSEEKPTNEKRRKKIYEYLLKEREKVMPKVEDEGLRERAAKYNKYAMDMLGKARARKMRIEDALRAFLGSKKK